MDDKTRGSIIYQDGIPGGGNKEIIKDSVKWF